MRVSCRSLWTRQRCLLWCSSAPHGTLRRPCCVLTTWLALPGGSIASAQSVVARIMAGVMDGAESLVREQGSLSGAWMCGFVGHCEWDGSLLCASRGCSCPRLEAAGDARSQGRGEHGVPPWVTGDLLWSRPPGLWSEVIAERQRLPVPPPTRVGVPLAGRLSPAGVSPYHSRGTPSIENPFKRFLIGRIELPWGPFLFTLTTSPPKRFFCVTPLAEAREQSHSCRITQGTGMSGLAKASTSTQEAEERLGKQPTQAADSTTFRAGEPG
jgi:hypothetical protein